MLENYARREFIRTGLKIIGGVALGSGFIIAISDYITQKPNLPEKKPANENDLKKIIRDNIAEFYDKIDSDSVMYFSHFGKNDKDHEYIMVFKPNKEGLISEAYLDCNNPATAAWDSLGDDPCDMYVLMYSYKDYSKSKKGETVLKVQTITYKNDDVNVLNDPSYDSDNPVNQAKRIATLQQLAKGTRQFRHLKQRIIDEVYRQCTSDSVPAFKTYKFEPDTAIKIEWKH